LKGDKIEINAETGRQMLAECKPFKLDPEDLGSNYHANYDPDEKEADKKKFKKDERLFEFDSMTDSSTKTEDRIKRDTQEENLQEFELEKDTGKNALKDFVFKPRIGPYECEQDPEEMIYPVNFYDNEDGFWDEKDEKFRVLTPDFKLSM